MAQLINITSEALQATIRRLLPSQQGFGEDLQATNVVTPIIDLTPTAEGSNIPTSMQQALNFDQANVFTGSNTTLTLATTSAFYRVVGSIATRSAGTIATSTITISNSSGTKDIWGAGAVALTSPISVSLIDFDFIIWLDIGDTLTFVVQNDHTVTGSLRQIADNNGVLTQPGGFNPQ